MSGEDVAVQSTGRLGFRLASTRDFAQVIWPFLRPYFRVIVFGYVVSLVTVVIASGFGLWVDAYLDSILTDPDLSQKASLYVGFSAVAIVSYALLTFVHAYAFAWVSIEVIRKVRRSLFHTILVQGGLLIDDDSSGELQTRVVADTSALGSFLGRELPGLFVGVLTLIFSIAGALYVRPGIPEEMFGAVFGNVFWLFLIPIAILIAMVMRKLQRLGKLTQKAEAQAGRYAGEAFRNWPVVHAFNQIDRECDRFGNAVDHFSLYSVASTRLKLAFDSMLFAYTCMFVYSHDKCSLNDFRFPRETSLKGRNLGSLEDDLETRFRTVADPRRGPRIHGCRRLSPAAVTPNGVRRLLVRLRLSQPVSA